MNENNGNTRDRSDHGHLILRQKPNETMIVLCGCGEKIIIQSLADRGGQVKLSFYAPKSVKIVREVILERQRSDEALK